ncbi:MAG: metalloregulator ArsR/SmtB family transcription factor [Bacteroidia bacterium]
MRRDVFQAIADPVRREIIDMLAEAPLNVNAVAEKFEISRPAISRHLKILSECGLVEIFPRGRERFCQIKPEKLIPAFLWMEQHKVLWEARLDAFEKYLEELQSNQKKDE